MPTVGTGQGGTTRTTTVVTASTGNTQYTWAKLVLYDAGLPMTKANIRKMVRWMRAEEPWNRWFNRNNPLNVGQPTSPSGTGSFKNLGVAAHYTAVALKGSNYKAIYSNLANTGSLTQFSAAVVASPWASSHYGGTPQHIARIPLPTGFPAPTATGNPQPGTAGGVWPVTTTGAVSTATLRCLVKFPGLAGVGSFCLLNEKQARAIKGGLLVVAGGVVMLVGVGMLAAFGFGSTAAQRQLRKVGVGGGGGSSPSPQPAPAPAPVTQEERNRRQVEALPPEVRDEARRRRESYGLTTPSQPAQRRERRPRAQQKSRR